MSTGGKVQPGLGLWYMGRVRYNFYPVLLKERVLSCPFPLPELAQLQVQETPWDSGW